MVGDFERLLIFNLFELLLGMGAACAAAVISKQPTRMIIAVVLVYGFCAFLAGILAQAIFIALFPQAKPIVEAFVRGFTTGSTAVYLTMCQIEPLTVIVDGLLERMKRQS